MKVGYFMVLFGRIERSELTFQITRYLTGNANGFYCNYTSINNLGAIFSHVFTRISNIAEAIKNIGKILLSLYLGKSQCFHENWVVMEGAPKSTPKFLICFRSYLVTPLFQKYAHDF